MAKRKRVELGAYIVSDPEICGGDLTFKGTRVLVKDVLYYLAEGEDWDSIVADYRNSFPREAIAEAISLANEALIGKVEKLRKAA
ncbi:MAG TPA: DUF433 domain-containing protein [Blastocatellia bacterium]|nr:DUF433 domain-containing protein [Blastocatellia bacterium]HMV85991.1 DUF433 domain-containing protein [Blastocatellia bacterium]HMX26316.1 DUF433 domain-containing protein [Blastocatellia bacterium]HMY73327.1 DUF433 domain-containing protein [Blastocatellia bacterium]HMZ22276.1 DUF433 domain-containing protein [Blastocatellia bacterium]